MRDIQCKTIRHGSLEYWDSVALRYKILRIPLNLDYGYSQLISENNDLHLASFSGGKMIACLILTPLENGQMKMRQVAVDDHLQGKGIGRALVIYSEEIARGKGFSEIVLNARETAVPFYLSLNYTVYGEPFTEVGIPHRSMRKKL